MFKNMKDEILTTFTNQEETPEVPGEEGEEKVPGEEGEEKVPEEE